MRPLFRLLEEAEHLWAAERNSSNREGVGGEWGRVCVLHNPTATPVPEVVEAWQEKVRAAGVSYRALPTAAGEEQLLDPHTGRALFEWPIDDDTKGALVNFDLLLMTATEATVTSGQYPTPQQIADAWKADTQEHVSYFHNNRRYGIATFEDQAILAVLREPPNPPMQPTAASGG